MKDKTAHLLLAAGTVTALILLGIAAIYAVWVADNRKDPFILTREEVAGDEKRKNGNSLNPLIKGLTESKSIDNGTPHIPGVKIYSAEQDSDLIKADKKNYEEDFQQNIIETKSSETVKNQQELLKQRNMFAAKRLEFLQKLEIAKTKDERLRLIEGFKKLSEEDN